MYCEIRHGFVYRKLGWDESGDIKVGMEWGRGDGRRGWTGNGNLGMDVGWKWGQKNFTVSSSTTLTANN